MTHIDARGEKVSLGKGIDDSNLLACIAAAIDFEWAVAVEAAGTDRVQRTIVSDQVDDLKTMRSSACSILATVAVVTMDYFWNDSGGLEWMMTMLVEHHCYHKKKRLVEHCIVTLVKYDYYFGGSAAAA
jgi:hypothetical protein